MLSCPFVHPWCAWGGLRVRPLGRGQGGWSLLGSAPAEVLGASLARHLAQKEQKLLQEAQGSVPFVSCGEGKGFFLLHRSSRATQGEIGLSCRSGFAGTLMPVNGDAPSPGHAVPCGLGLLHERR